MKNTTAHRSARQTLFLTLVTAAPLVTGLVLGWLFSLDGTLGTVRAALALRIGVGAIGVLGISAPLLALLGRGRHALRVLAVVLGTLGLLVPLALGFFFLRSTFQYAAPTPPLLLIADGVGANGVPDLALTFRSAQETQNTLYYGEASLNQKIAEPSAVRQHVLPLKDLKPGTHYQWRLNDGATCSFVTPAVQSSSETLLHFGAAGDAHLTSAGSGSAGGNPKIISSVLTYAGEPGNQFNAFFMLGDLVNMGSSFEDWQTALQTVAPFTCAIPLRPLMGNHDALFNGAPQYVTYLYPQGMQTSLGTRTYYRIDSGRVHILMLKMLWGTDSFSAEQRTWFIQQLESIPSGDWTVVMMHSMVYASGVELDGFPYYDPADMIQQVAPLLEKYKVDLVISGHDHDLEFLQKNGVSYAVVGGLGAPLSPVATYKSPASVWYAPQQFGFLDVTIHPTTIDLHFRDPNGNELKSFSIGQNQ
jgi:acid phosphatase type 7